jgi:GIY-YIG catalytic domain
MAGYTYIIGSPTGTLYIGVTSDIYIRIQQHKNGTFEGFSKQYNCTRLLYYEQHEDIRQLAHSYGCPIHDSLIVMSGFSQQRRIEIRPDPSNKRFGSAMLSQLFPEQPSQDLRQPFSPSRCILQSVTVLGHFSLFAEIPPPTTSPTIQQTTSTARSKII